jgi:hypothetical protein
VDTKTKGVGEVFQDAKVALDAARSRLQSATSDFINAERRYNEASRAFVAERFPHQDVK